MQNITKAEKKSTTQARKKLELLHDIIDGRDYRQLKELIIIIITIII